MNLSQPEKRVFDLTNAESLVGSEIVQTLWSGYGEIRRYHLRGGSQPSVVVKHVDLPDEVAHPRGWNTNLSHQRKIRSYQVESAWYTEFASQCDQHCRVPKALHVEKHGESFLMILEDLDARGFSIRHGTLSFKQMRPCIEWLAYFHARFMGVEPIGLWPTGTYWHLATRPDELDALEDRPLKMAAKAIDQTLSACRFQTLVHGDAKLANFCFSEDGHNVAAVDFQYVGGGCGMKDLAYFVGSCLYEEDCERYEQAILDLYFQALETALRHYQSERNEGEIKAADIEAAWRPLYKFAWADFHRFVKGWSPGHWKINTYSERMTKDVIEEIAGAADRG